MSGEAFGVVALAPVAAGAAVAAAAAVVGAVVIGGVVIGGGIVVRQGGRLLLACGHELANQASQNLAMQSQLQRAARNYECQLREREREREYQSAEAVRARHTALEETLRQRDAAIAALRAGGPVKVVQVDWSVLQQPAWESPIEHFEPLSAWFERLAASANRLRNATEALDRYVTGERCGLFNLGAWQDELGRAREKLVELQGPHGKATLAVMRGEARPNLAALSEIDGVIEAVQAHLVELHALAPLREEQRKAAMERIEQARAAVHQHAGAEAAGPRLDGLEIAVATLGDALAEAARCEFLAAESAARAALQHFARLDQVVADQRRLNLQHMLDDLRARVEPLRQAQPLAERAAQWLADAATCQSLLEQDVAAAWETVERSAGLAARADQLTRSAVQWVQSQQAETVLKAASETLAEMGYETSGHQDGATHTLVGRQGDRKVLLGLAESGEIHAEFKGHGDATCAQSYQAFFAGLEKRGVIAAVQSRFSLEEAVDDLVQTLREAGLNTKVEPGAGGVTVIATGQPGAAGRVSYDGLVSISDELEELWQGRVRDTLVGQGVVESQRAQASQRNKKKREVVQQKQRVLA